MSLDFLTSEISIDRIRENLRKKLLQCCNRLELFQNNINHPLASYCNFKYFAIKKRFRNGLKEMNIFRPTQVQMNVLKEIGKHDGHLIVQSQTGTGKTLAYLLAGMQGICEKLFQPQMIVICPTYFLAFQSFNMATKIAKYSKLEMRYISSDYKSTPPDEHILFITPPVLVKLAPEFNLTNVFMLVIDEADIMFDSVYGYREELEQIFQYLPSDCKILNFSATYNKEMFDYLLDRFETAKALKLYNFQENLDNIHQYYLYEKDMDEKYNILKQILAALCVVRTLIFCQYRNSAYQLSHRLDSDGFNNVHIKLRHYEQNFEEIQCLTNYTNDKIFISTSSIARGVDASNISVVINYDLPIHQFTEDVDYENYLYQIGRAGRAGKDGIAITFVKNLKEYELIKNLQKHFDHIIFDLNHTFSEDYYKLLISAKLEKRKKFCSFLAQSSSEINLNSISGNESESQSDSQSESSSENQSESSSENQSEFNSVIESDPDFDYEYNSSESDIDKLFQ